VSLSRACGSLISAAAARASTDLRDQLLIELPAQIGVNHWLRVSLGKLHDDRYVPMHPQLVAAAVWTAGPVGHAHTAHVLRRVVSLITTLGLAPLRPHTVGWWRPRGVRLEGDTRRAASTFGRASHRLATIRTNLLT
jgi:hypothetical protein